MEVEVPIEKFTYLDASIINRLYNEGKIEMAKQPGTTQEFLALPRPECYLKRAAAMQDLAGNIIEVSKEEAEPPQDASAAIAPVTP
jgi:hypothetical protein